MNLSRYELNSLTLSHNWTFSCGPKLETLILPTIFHDMQNLSSTLTAQLSLIRLNDVGAALCEQVVSCTHYVHLYSHTQCEIKQRALRRPFVPFNAQMNQNRNVTDVRLHLWLEQQQQAEVKHVTLLLLALRLSLATLCLVGKQGEVLGLFELFV